MRWGVGKGEMKGGGDGVAREIMFFEGRVVSRGALFELYQFLHAIPRQRCNSGE